MKIVLYGTCSFPYLYREIIRQAADEHRPFEWRVLALSWRHLPLFDGILPREEVYYIPPHINRLMREPTPDLSLLKNYPDSFVKDLAADKDVPGQLKRQPSEYQMKNALAYYRVFKEYLQREKPDMVFSPIVETHDGMILYGVARELGIPMTFAANARNLRVSFFTEDPNETLPPYVLNANPAPELAARAQAMIADFRKSPTKAFGFSYTPREDEIIDFPRFRQGYEKMARLPVALWNLWKDARLEPHAGRANPLWYQPREQFAAITRLVNRAKGRYRRRYQQILRLEQIPERFVYFPLHVYPELTITTMAPFYEDQLRAIDLIRFSMPPDHVLVVKEHPMMKGRRTSAFYRALRKKPGVLLADSDLSSLEFMRGASITVAITGTATFEALLLGKPSLLLARTFFSPWLPRLENIDTFGETLRRAIAEDPAEIDRRGIDCVARVLWAGHDFIIYDPHTPDWDPKWVMNRRNIHQFLTGLLDHLDRKRGLTPAS